MNIFTKILSVYLTLIVGIIPTKAIAYDENDPGEVEISEQVLCRVQKGGVFQNFTVLDEKPCEKIVMHCRQYQGSKSCPIAYHWPSGSKTVVEYADRYHTQPIRINGNRALSPNAIADHSCVLNTKSDNLFCVFHPDDPQVANASTSKTANNTNEPVKAGQFSGIEALVEKRWYDFYKDNVVVESIEMIEREETSVFGIKVLEATFKSVVHIKEPFRGVCVSAKGCIRAMGINNDGMRTVPAGRYEDISRLSFEKGENFWVLNRD